MSELTYEDLACVYLDWTGNDFNAFLNEIKAFKWTGPYKLLEMEVFLMETDKWAESPDQIHKEEDDPKLCELGKDMYWHLKYPLMTREEFVSELKRINTSTLHEITRLISQLRERDI